MQMPTLRQLEYIVAVAEEGHFGRAAARCAVSQPALSKQIAEAEGVLGVIIFERVRPQTRVTLGGAAIVEQARRVLAAARELLHVAGQVGEEAAGPLQLGCIPTLAPYVLPGLMHALKDALPGLKLTLVEAKTDALVQHLRTGRLDVALLALPLEDADGLEARAAWDDPFVLAMPPQHPLARGTGPLELDALRGEELLLLEEGHCFRTQALKVCAATSSGASWIAASSMATLTLMVQQGLGATLLPQSALEVELGRAPGLVVRSFVAPAPRRTVGLCWRAGTTMGALIEGLERALRAVRGGEEAAQQIGSLAHDLADPIYRARASV